MKEEVYQLGYLKFIRDKDDYNHIYTEDLSGEEYHQEVRTRCPSCDSRIKVGALMPEVLGTTDELVWYCRCTNDKECSTEEIFIKTDNPVKLSLLDAFIQEFVEMNTERKEL